MLKMTTKYLKLSYHFWNKAHFGNDVNDQM